MRHGLLALVLGLALVPAPAGARTEKWREQSEKVIDGRGLVAVRAENARGLISVRATDDSEIRLIALKISRGQDTEHAMKFARATQVETTNENGRLTIKVRYPQRQNLRVGFWDLFSGGFEFPRVEVRLALEVPRRLAVTLGSTSGDLETDGVSGNQTIGTTSGDVTVSDARGDLEASSTSGNIDARGIRAGNLRTVSGDIRVERAQGPLIAHTTSGDIQLSGIGDTLELTSVSGLIQVDHAPRGVTAQSTSGDIRVGVAGGAVRAETSSGDVRVELGESVRSSEIQTASGDIEVDLAGPIGCALDLRTSSGSLDVTAPLEVQTVSRRVVTGNVGNGAVPVRLRSSSGDIVVRGGGN